VTVGGLPPGTPNARLRAIAVSFPGKLAFDIGVRRLAAVVAASPPPPLISDSESPGTLGLSVSPRLPFLSPTLAHRSNPPTTRIPSC
jgi:hypothetical protein